MSLFSTIKDTVNNVITLAIIAASSILIIKAGESCAAELKGKEVSIDDITFVANAKEMAANVGRKVGELGNDYVIPIARQINNCISR